MDTRIFSIDSEALPASAHVICFRGSEGLSRPFRFAIGIQLDAAKPVDPALLIGTRATLNIHLQEDAAPYRFHGIVACCELVHQWQAHAAYRLVLVPSFWRTTLTKHSRVFVDDTIPAIIEQVLRASGLSTSDYELRLSGRYEPHEFVAQYKESDFAFLSRWMEREGMYYFFEQGDQQERLIIVDSLGFHENQPGAPVRYVPLTGEDDVMVTQAFDSFIAKHQAVPSKVELTDYDYLHPTLEVAGRAEVAGGLSGEISLFGENFLTPDRGNRYAKLRAEELAAGKELYFAAGRVFHLRPGYKLTLEEHPRASFNATYLTIELEHHGNQSAASNQLKRLFDVEYDDEYHCSLTAMPAEVQYRAPSVTRWPRIDGYEAAVVCGAATSEYAQIDEHGRYRVRIMFDESDLDDGTASAWVRMLQPHGGSTEGFHFPLRKGTEVLLLFEGGNPDRPVISGVVPNAVTPSPVLSGNHTLNVIQTGGTNRIELEDRAGSQYIHVSTPPEDSYLHLGAPNSPDNVVLHTTGCTGFFTGQDKTIKVGGNMTEDVTGDVEETYHSNHTTTLDDGNWKVEVDGTLFEHITDSVTKYWDSGVTYYNGASLRNNVETFLFEHVKGFVHEDYDGAQKTTVGEDYTLWVDGGGDIDFGEDTTLDVNGQLSETVTGLKKEHYGTVETTIDSADTTTILGAAFTRKLGSHAKTITTGTSVSLWAGAKLGLSASADATISAGASLAIKAAVTATIAATVSLKLRTLAIDLNSTEISQHGIGVKQAAVKTYITGGPDILVSALCLLM